MNITISDPVMLAIISVISTYLCYKAKQKKKKNANTYPKRSHQARG